MKMWIMKKLVRLFKLEEWDLLVLRNSIRAESDNRFMRKVLDLLDEAEAKKNGS